MWQCLMIPILCHVNRVTRQDLTYVLGNFFSKSEVGLIFRILNPRLEVPAQDALASPYQRVITFDYSV